jgi:hypothetical protein
MDFKPMTKERRLESCMLCADLVQVCWSDATGQPHSVVANLEEISTHGAQLVLEAPVPRGTKLVLRMAWGDIAATASACRDEPDFGFALTVRLPKKGRWESHPRHHFIPTELGQPAPEQKQVL